MLHQFMFNQWSFKFLLTSEVKVYYSANSFLSALISKCFQFDAETFPKPFSNQMGTASESETLHPFHATGVFLCLSKKDQKTKGFLMFSRGIVRNQCPEMGWECLFPKIVILNTFVPEESTIRTPSLNRRQFLCGPLLLFYEIQVNKGNRY